MVVTNRDQNSDTNTHDIVVIVWHTIKWNVWLHFGDGTGVLRDDDILMTKAGGSRWVREYDYFLMTLGEGIQGDGKINDLLIT